jgi:hypothetical protein
VTNVHSRLETEIEEARERLGRTIDELAVRARPQSIATRKVSQFKSHFVDSESGNVRTDTVAKIAVGVVGVAVVYAVLRRITR